MLLDWGERQFLGCVSLDRSSASRTIRQNHLQSAIRNRERGPRYEFHERSRDVQRLNDYCHFRRIHLDLDDRHQSSLPSGPTPGEYRGIARAYRLSRDCHRGTHAHRRMGEVERMMEAQLPGGLEWLIVLLVAGAILLFGPKKIPELARGLGRAMGEFRRGKVELEREIDELREGQDGRT